MWITSLVVSCLVTLASAHVNFSGIINQQVKRTIHVTSPIFREEYTIIAKYASASGQPIHNYLHVVPSRLATHFSHISAGWDGGVQGSPTKQLPVNEVTENCPMGARCFVINFARPLTPEGNPTNIFVIGIAYTDIYSPHPSVASQDAPLRMKALLSPYYYSPYVTITQKTVVNVVKEFELVKLDCPKPNNMEAAKIQAGMGPMTGASQYSCGPYPQKDAFTDEPTAMTIHYKTSQIPFIKFNKMDRTIRVNVRDQRLYVTEEYEIRHMGHGLKDGAFSKVAFLQAFAKGTYKGQIQPAIHLGIPAKAENIELRDELGLLTSPLGRREAPMGEKWHMLEVQPRNVLNGGWSLEWQLSYSVPFDGLIERIQVEELKRSAMRLVFHIYAFSYDISIERYSTNIIIPSQATVFGAEPILTSVDSYITSRVKSVRPTAFWITSEKSYKFTMKNVVREHESVLMMLFDYPWYTAYVQVFGIFVIAIATIAMLSVISNVDFSIEKRVRSDKDNANLAFILQERRELLKKLNENRHDKAAIIVLLVSLEEISNSLKGNDQGIVTLKKLYQSQESKIKAIFTEGKADVISRLEKDAIDLDERILQTEASVLSEK